MVYRAVISVVNQVLERKKEIGSSYVLYIHINPQFSEYINKAAYYQISLQEKLIRQGLAMADTFHRSEENNILGRWATALSADGSVN
jgi:hypothetical protein